ncbi:MAG: pyridoxine 5'-phosphate synthase [Alphaproteobacteria bacterium]|jgi:pyridoxine 5-phosphate synthase|nr:pyridoxine 5'-phosphate synthase [Alphaproteobacteria bacterium]MDP6587950.1 pyridoxine 5'-phosphate synthase [Alphaproteobacteria bacterium]MDP6818241.1 pyridoxine 5'-phosphate synthase [Alphaproteobacteria bacterium]|tara:strand:+ start:1467 stop:2225 length:759 start_codon:yes stop_codon:yes gene_type:complete
MSEKLRLGVNIDHVATIRNARGGDHPEPVRAAKLAAAAGADGLVCHLREDRRHISDRDLERLMAEVDLPLNLEMAATDEMLEIALRHSPPGICLVPEKRQELTTEGGLDVAAAAPRLASFVASLSSAGCLVCLFVDPNAAQLDASLAAGAAAVELHTGTFCDAPPGAAGQAELERLRDASTYAASLGLEVRAGHGLSFDSVAPIAAIPEIVELNIGHFLIGEAIFSGLDSSIRRMRALMDKARAEALGERSA